MKVNLDKEIFNRNTWNNSYGNKILHVMFGLGIVEKYGGLIVSEDLDDLSDFIEINVVSTGEVAQDGLLLKENTAFSLGRIDDFIFSQSERINKRMSISKLLKVIGISKKWRNKVLRNSRESLERLNSEILDIKSEREVSICGHFWHYNLMPSQKFIQKNIFLANQTSKNVLAKYGNLAKPNAVAVHFRRTDFKTHMQTIFPESICLPLSYYSTAIAKIEELIGDSCIFHLFGDDYESALKIFEGKHVVRHDDSAAEDWVALANTKNVIQSNSSFCWTASLFVDGYSVQPAGGYNYFNSQEGDYPYGFSMDNSYLISFNE